MGLWGYGTARVQDFEDPRLWNFGRGGVWGSGIMDFLGLRASGALGCLDFGTLSETCAQDPRLLANPEHNEKRVRARLG